MALLKTSITMLVSAAAVLAGVALIVRLLESWITFYPTGRLEYQPRDFGLEHEEVTIRVGRSDSLHGWHFPPRDDSGPVLLVFHGNAGNISHRLEWLAPFVGRGLGLLIFDYRGYGLSSGRPSEDNFRQDALAVWDWLAGTRGVRAGRIVAFGRSLGSAPAVFLATEREVGGLILEGALTSGKDMSRRMFGRLPMHLAAKNKWDVQGRLLRVRVPTLLVHGDRDDVVPFEMGLRLQRTGTAGTLEWWPVSGGGHLDLYRLLGNVYYDRLESFALDCAGETGD